MKPVQPLSFPLPVRPVRFRPFRSRLFPAAAFPLLLSFLTAGCEWLGEKNGALPSEEATLAVVNNKTIQLAEFQRNTRRFLARFPMLEDAYRKDPKRIKDLVIERMIDRELMFQEATRKRITFSQEELETLANAALNPYDGSKTRNWLEKANLRPEDWKEAHREFFIIQNLVQREVNDKIAVGEEEIELYYRNHREEFTESKSHRVLHILVHSEETAELVLRQLKKKADFETMIDEYSIAADKVNGGTMGFVKQGQMPAEIDGAIFKLKRANQISPVVASPLGYHIFKLENVRKRRRIPLEEAKETIRGKLAEERFDEAYAAWLEKLKAKSNISIDTNLLHKDEGF